MSKPIYEYTEVSGERRENGIHNYPVSTKEINEMAREGWDFVAWGERQFTALMRREITKEEPSC